MQLLVIDQSGTEHALSAGEGEKLMEVIRDAGLQIAAQCGGCCSCATCHVYVDDAWLNRLPAKSDDEDAMLELAIDPLPNSRLSCQIITGEALSGLEVRLAPGTEL